MIYKSIIAAKLAEKRTKVINLLNKYIGKQIKSANGSKVTISDISSDAYIITDANKAYSIASFRNKFTINNQKLLSEIDKLLCLDRIQNSLGAYNRLTTLDTMDLDGIYYNLLTEALKESDFKLYELLANRYITLYKDEVVNKIGSVDSYLLKHAQSKFSIKVLSLIVENIENGIPNISKANPKIAKDYYLTMYAYASSSDLRNNQVFTNKFKLLINYGISSDVNTYIENSYALSSYLYNIGRCRYAVLTLRAIAKYKADIKGEANKAILKMVYFALGTSYLEGRGAKRDLDKALLHFRKAPNILHITDVVKAKDGSLFAIDDKGNYYGKGSIGSVISNMVSCSSIGVVC